MIYQDNKLLIVKIPDFKTKFEISHSRRAKYFDTENDKIPKKYSNGDLYSWMNTTIYDRLTGKKVIKNTRVAGTPKYWVLNGQTLYNGNMHQMVRNKVTNLVHGYLSSYLKESVPIELKTGEYLRIRCILSELKGVANWDCSNRWPWIKWFEDTLVETGIISEDKITVVRDSGSIYFNEVENIEDRSLIFVVEKFKPKKNVDIIEELYGIKTTFRDQE